MSEADINSYLSTITDSLDDIISRISLPDGKFEFINKACEKITGYTREEFFEKPGLILQIIHPEWHPQFNERWKNALNGHVEEEMEYLIVHKNKGLRWVSTKSKVIKNDVACPVAFQSITRDITDRKKAEKESRDSEEKYKTIFETAANIIFSVDPENIILECNNQITTLLGYSTDEIKGQPVSSIIHPDYRDCAEEAFEKLGKKGYIYDRECVFLRKSGIRMFVSINARAVSDTQGNFIRFICIVNDITEHKYTLEALTRETIISNELVAIGKEILSKQVTIRDIAVAVQSAALKLTKSKYCLVILVNKENKNEVISSNFEKAEELKKIAGNIGYGCEEQEGQMYRNVLSNKAPFLTKIPEENALLKNLTGTPIKGSISVPAIADKKILGRIIIADHDRDYNEGDMDALKKISNIFALGLLHMVYENRLIRSKEKAEESDRLKSAFLANMSHEIRTPMNGILGFTDILHNDNISKEKKESYLTYIESSTRRLLSILNNIILFSRIEAGEITVKVTEFNLNDLLNELITDVRLKAVNENKQGLKINLNMEFPDENSIISSDKEKLSQILWHLLDNAVKFTDEGFIELGYYLNQLNNTLYFYVKDTGIGILKSSLAIIFEKFRQEDESHTRRFGGTGLGLAITKKLTDLIGGELKVESQKNKGSIFFFELPFNPVKLQSAKKAATEHSPLAIEDYDWHDKNILIVEDEEANFHYFKAILHSTRAIIHYAKSGKIALEKARENKNLDLVLMDIKLPDINGYEVTRQIKEIRNIPVIAQTAYAYPEDEEEAFLAGCDDFITKPIDKDKLLGKIQRLLDTMK